MRHTHTPKKKSFLREIPHKNEEVIIIKEFWWLSPNVYLHQTLKDVKEIIH